MNKFNTRIKLLLFLFFIPNFSLFAMEMSKKENEFDYISVKFEPNSTIISYSAGMTSPFIPSAKCIAQKLVEDKINKSEIKNIILENFHNQNAKTTLETIKKNIREKIKPSDELSILIFIKHLLLEIKPQINPDIAEINNSHKIKFSEHEKFYTFDAIPYVLHFIYKGILQKISLEENEQGDICQFIEEMLEILEL